MRCTRYRPRQPRASPVWQVLRDHAHRLPDLDPETARALARFQRCGDLHSGFTRLHCPDCGHDYLLAFTCKQRGLCASCHQRRTLTEAATIAEDICQPVPHRHLVLTLPRVLRGLFQREPALLGELYHATHEVLTLWLRERAACPNGQPGLVVAVQTFGDYLLWHPHVHVLATAGVFTADGTFHLADTGGWDALRELWRHALLRRLREARALAPDTLAAAKPGATSSAKSGAPIPCAARSAPVNSAPSPSSRPLPRSMPPFSPLAWPSWPCPRPTARPVGPHLA